MSTTSTASLSSPKPAQSLAESNTATLAMDTAQEKATHKPRKGLAFALVMLSLCVSSFLSALDLTSVSTVLATMTKDLGSGSGATDYTWIGSAYALSSTAFIPWTGSLAHIFGRRAVMLGSLIFFMVGSAVTGSAQSINVAIVGRTLQGVGGGGILTMTEIVVVDMVPLAERGLWMGILGSVWALSSAIGPPIGGALASAGAWRWLFYLNLPIGAIAMVLVAVFMNLKAPATTWREKSAQMDYANVLFVAASTSTILALTWGGSSYAWSSFRVLVPLILGLVGMGLYLWIEKRFVKNPTVPFEILSNLTSLVGFFTNFTHGIVVLAAVYYLPVYFQSSFGASPVKAGVDLFSLSFTIAPFAMVAGATVTMTGHYKLQNVLGWVLMTIGFGLTSMLKWNSVQGAWVGYPIVMGIGMGLLYAGTTFPVLAPLSVAQQPHAMAFHAFTRSFGQVIGIAIAGTVLQNELTRKLPASYLSGQGGFAGAYASIPTIKDLAEPLRTQVRAAFAESLRTIWYVCVGICAFSLIVALFMRSLSLATETDENWGLEERKKSSESKEEKVEQQV